MPRSAFARCLGCGKDLGSELGANGSLRCDDCRANRRPLLAANARKSRVQVAESAAARNDDLLARLRLGFARAFGGRRARR